MNEADNNTVQQTTDRQKERENDKEIERKKKTEAEQF